MGAGILWFATSRMDAGWSRAQVIRRTASNGFAILLVGQFLETSVLFTISLLSPAAVQLSHMPMPMPNDRLPPFAGLITLSGLGGVMMVCSLLLYLRPVAWIAVAMGAVLATHALLPASCKVGPAWFTILLAPGLSQHVLVMYPFIPWLAVAAIGMYCGYAWKQRPEWRDRIWILDLGLILFALVLRLGGSWGNIVPPYDSSWIEFLNNVKYPPSLVFWTIAIGVDLLLLFLLMRLPPGCTASRSPLMVFGQTPLFFYVVHFYVLSLIAFSFFVQAAPLYVTYPVWLVLLVIIYVLCHRFRHFKMAKPPESLWRLF